MKTQIFTTNYVSDTMQGGRTVFRTALGHLLFISRWLATSYAKFTVVPC